MRKAWLAFCFAAVTAVATAQEPQPPSTPPPGAAPVASSPARLLALASPLRLTPQTAAEVAVQRSADLAISEQSIAAARANVRLAEAQKGLRVEAQASYTRMGPTQSITLPESMGGGQISFTAPESHVGTLAVTKPLYLGERDRYARQAAQAGVQAAEQNLQAGIVSVAVVAREALFTLLRLQQLSVVAEQRLTAIAEHLRVTRAMFEAGTTARFEVVQAETELAQAKGDLVAAQTAVAEQKAYISQLLLVPQGTEIIAEEGVPAPVPEGDLHQLIAKAIADRPELDSLQAAVRAQQANLRLAEANDNLSVAVQGNVNVQTATAASSETNWNVTVGLTKPIYQGGETRARVDAARAALKTAELNVERVEQQIALQVSQALLSLQQATEQLQVAEQGEVEAQERARIALVRFQNGVSLGVEVIDAQTALAAAQTNVVNARYDLQVAVASLRAALGLTDLPKES
ncbi:MAG: TolC family protein [Armatimonadia bacterium]